MTFDVDRIHIHIHVTDIRVWTLLTLTNLPLLIGKVADKILSGFLVSTDDFGIFCDYMVNRVSYWKSE